MTKVRSARLEVVKRAAARSAADDLTLFDDGDEEAVRAVRQELQPVDLSARSHMLSRRYDLDTDEWGIATSAMDPPWRAPDAANGGLSGMRPESRPCQTLTLAEAAVALGIGRSTAYKLAKQGAFPVPVLEIGPVMRISKVHLDRYLATAVPIRPGADALS